MSAFGSKADEIQAERYVSLWPKADIGRVEIPQRSSLLPHRGVLSFRLEAPGRRQRPASMHDLRLPTR